MVPGDEIPLSPAVRAYVANIISAALAWKAPDLAAPLLLRPEDGQRLAEAARARARKMQRIFVTPEDVKIVGCEILRDRIILTREASEKKVSAENLARRLIDDIDVP